MNNRLKVSPDFIPVNHNVGKNTFELIKQLEVGDVVTVRIDEKGLDGRHTCRIVVKKATIFGFNSPWDHSPIVVTYNEPQQDEFSPKYSIPLSWIVIDDVILRDIKINRVISL